MRILIFLLLLAGCSPVPEIRAANENSVLVGATTTKNIDQSMRLADAECAKYGKKAVFVPDGNQDGMVSFNCQ